MLVNLDRMHNLGFVEMLSCWLSVPV